MILHGFTVKVGKWWHIECPALQVMTQGKTKKDAYFMLADALKLGIEEDNLDIEIVAGKDGQLDIKFNSHVPKVLGFMMNQNRELSFDELASKLGISSKSAARNIFTGKNDPKFSRALEVFDALGFDVELKLRKRA